MEHQENAPAHAGATENKLPLDQEAEQKLMQVLPRTLIAALTSYENFLTAGSQPENKEPATPSESKDYQEHQSACKAAVAHIELLARMADRMKVFSAGDQKDHIEQLEDFVIDALGEIDAREKRKEGDHDET